MILRSKRNICSESEDTGTKKKRKRETKSQVSPEAKQRRQKKKMICGSDNKKEGESSASIPRMILRSSKKKEDEESKAGASSLARAVGESLIDDAYMRGVERQVMEAREYSRQVCESDGFDIDEHVIPGVRNQFVNFLPADQDYLENRRHIPLLKFCKAALGTYHRHNRVDKNNRFKFKEFAYATHRPNATYITYLLTFHATHVNGSANQVFQAHVVDHWEFGDSPHIPKVQFCRFKAPPVVNNVRIVGELVEGSTVRGTGYYVGGRQGKSKFEWLRQDRNTGMREPLVTGTTKYTITREDIGHYLIFRYTPVNSVGQEGECRWMLSEEIKQVSPPVKRVSIVEENCETP